MKMTILQEHVAQINKIIDLANEKAEQDKFDDGYAWKVEDSLPKMVKALPKPFVQKYLDIIQASAEKDSHNVGTFILTEQIPKQLGFVEEKYSFNSPLVKEGQRDFYLDMALQLAENNPHFDSDLLKNVPSLIREQGFAKAGKIMRTAMKVKDSDFPGEHNVVLLYTGMKAGHRFGGDPEEHKRLVNQVEHKYLGVPLIHKREFTRKSIDDFCKRVDSMKDPRKRRAAIQSTYAEIKRERLGDLDSESIENFTSLCERYGFEDHANKLLDTRHYKNVRKYDDTIRVHPIEDKESLFSAFYQTADTRKLDALFNLEGKPVDESHAKSLMSPSIWIGRTEQEYTMPRFANVAGKLGHFVGLQVKEAAEAFGISEGFIKDCVREGYLESFKDEGRDVVAPTAKYQPFGL